MTSSTDSTKHDSRTRGVLPYVVTGVVATISIVVGLTVGFEVHSQLLTIENQAFRNLCGLGCGGMTPMELKGLLTFLLLTAAGIVALAQAGETNHE